LIDIKHATHSTQGRNRALGPLEAIWHLLNFAAPAVSLGLVTSAMAKLLWRRHLESVSWWRLAGWTAANAVLVLLVALVTLGGDGKMMTYAAMVLASALTLWWVGFAARR
jgi:hypothetical protein